MGGPAHHSRPLAPAAAARPAVLVATAASPPASYRVAQRTPPIVAPSLQAYERRRNRQIARDDTSWALLWLMLFGVGLVKVRRRLPCRAPAPIVDGSSGSGRAAAAS
jgi:hypothetical protein